MVTSDESHADTTAVWAVTVALTAVALPIVQQGPVSHGRVLSAALLGAFAIATPRVVRYTRLSATLPRLNIRAVVLGCILATGVAFRLRALFAVRSLWFDEVSLAANIADRSLLELLTTQLSAHQSAPPGFLTASWFAYETAGTGLIWVRAVPFAAGVLTLVVGTHVARSVFHSFLAQAGFVAMLAWSPILIFYSTELKQYSTDVLVVTVALYLAHTMAQRRSGWLAALLGFAAVISSLAGLIVFFLLALIVLSSGFAKQRLRGVYAAGQQHIAALCAWLFAATLHLIYTVVAGADREYMQEYWRARAGFAPQSLGSFDDVWWYGDRFRELVWLTFDATEMVGPGMHNGAVWLVVAVGVLLVAAARSVWRHNWTLQLAALMLLGAFMLAQFNAYPLSSRLALYLIPALVFLMASGIDRLWGSSRRVVGRPISVALALLLGASLIATSISQFAAPFLGKDMHGALKVVAREWQSGDAVWTVPTDMPVVEWHRAGAGFTAPVIAVDSALPRTRGPIAGLQEHAPSRLWIVSSVRRREARQLLEKAIPEYEASAVYSQDDTFIALLSNTGPVMFEPTGDRNLLRLRSHANPAGD